MRMGIEHCSYVRRIWHICLHFSSCILPHLFFSIQPPPLKKLHIFSRHYKAGYLAKVDERLAAGAGGVVLEERGVQPTIDWAPQVVHTEPDRQQVQAFISHRP